MARHGPDPAVRIDDGDLDAQDIELLRSGVGARDAQKQRRGQNRLTAWSHR